MDQERKFVLKIGEGKDIRIELPRLLTAGMESETEPEEIKDAQRQPEDIVKSSMKHLYFRVKQIRFGEETTFENGILTIRETIADEACKDIGIVKKLTLDIITPENQDIYTDTIMDICPIAVKKEGILGEGITHVMSGAVMMLTGVDENGKQISDANSSDGIFSDRMAFGKPGAVDAGELVIRASVVIEGGRGKERPGPFNAHKAADYIVDEIRQVLKQCQEQPETTRVFNEVERVNRPRILLVKEIMGQGAMHDNLILPAEPAGMQGGIANVDLGNMPVLLSPNEVFDGGVHALTCITPDTKETTRAYFREPFLDKMVTDEQFNVVGVVFVGSPQANTDKAYVSARLGKWAEALKLDGAIITTEGYGNNHVDFASHIYNMGKVGIDVVGVSFCGVQGALVVGNKFMDALVDLACESSNGIATDRIGENSVTQEAAITAVAMLKNKMMKQKIEPADKKWDYRVHEQNLESAKESNHAD